MIKETDYVIVEMEAMGMASAEANK